MWGRGGGAAWYPLDPSVRASVSRPTAARQLSVVWRRGWAGTRVAGPGTFLLVVHPLQPLLLCQWEQLVHALPGMPQPLLQPVLAQQADVLHVESGEGRACGCMRRDLAAEAGARSPT